MKRTKFHKVKNFSGDQSKIYPFTNLDLNDSRLLDKSFNFKFQKKLLFLTEKLKSSIQKNEGHKTLVKKQPNTKIQNILRARIKNIFPDNCDASIVKGKTCPKSPQPKVQFSLLRKTISFAGNSKKIIKNKSLALNESVCQESPSVDRNRKVQSDSPNLVVKQRSLSDSVEKKSHFDLKKNKSIFLEKDDKEKDNNTIAKNEVSFSMETIDLIRDELEKKEDMRNVMRLDDILRNLYYLKKFSLFYRKKILRNCKFYEFEQNTIIFNQDDVADNVYIILRGAVSIQIRNAKFPITLKTLYDGEHFGDLNLEAKPTQSRKRQATCLCAERTFLLGINQLTLQDLLFDKNEKLQYYYFKFLRGLFIFENIDDYTVSNFARNIRRIKYKYGETIVNQGEVPQGMHIIFKGSCNAVKETVCVRGLKPSEFNVRLKPSNRGNSNEKEKNLKHEDPRINYLKKYFNYKEISSNKYQYKEQVFYKKLNSGDIFTGYILLFDNYIDAEEKYSKEATYSVIADDLVVEIWIFEKFLMNFLAKSTLVTSFLELIKCVDLPNEKKQCQANKEDIEKWHQYKMRLYENKIQENYWIKRKRRDSYFL